MEAIQYSQFRTRYDPILYFLEKRNRNGLNVARIRLLLKILIQSGGHRLNHCLNEAQEFEREYYDAIEDYEITGEKYEDPEFTISPSYSPQVTFYFAGETRVQYHAISPKTSFNLDGRKIALSGIPIRDRKFGINSFDI